MARHEIQFPSNISYGSSGGPGHNTLYLDSKGGSQTRIARWGGAIRQYDVRNGVKTVADMTALIEFYLAREGGLHSFRFKDWSDFSTDTTRVGTAAFDDFVIGTGNGVQDQFQLVSKYTSGAQTRTRNLQAPVAGTVKSGVAGSERGEGTPTTGWTVDATTGIITYETPPTAAQTVTAGCQFDVPAHFGPGSDAILGINLDTCDIRSVPSIQIVEDPSTVPVDDEMHWGGGAAASFSIATQITPLGGRAWALTPGAATDLILPLATEQPAGGPHFFLANLSGTHTIQVKSGGVNVGTIAANQAKTACVFLISGVKTWRIF